MIENISLCFCSGERQITARFPDHDVRITNFRDLGDADAPG
jgi:hypothetical protein